MVLLFGAPAVFLSVIPILVAAGALTGFRVSEGTAKLLPQSSFASRFAVLVHGKPRFTEGMTGGKPGGIFGIPLVERNDSVAAIKILHRVVDVLFIISLVADKGTFVDIAKALAFHDNGCAEHGFFGKAGTTGFCARQLKVERGEELIVKRSGTLRSEQGDVANDFLSVDSGQPLSVWFSCN